MNPPSALRKTVVSFLVVAFAGADAGMALGAGLRGSKASVRRQNIVADQHDFTHIRNPAELRKFVKMGLLVRLPGNADYTLRGVSFPYARPAVKLFVERLSRQYHAATGERLVVTSLTRPLTHQPRNASDNSVHPTGMALDIRRSGSRAARKWLEQNLLVMEGRGVIEATHERHPPHYHVAVFPNEYEAYVARRTKAETEEASAREERVLPNLAGLVPPGSRGATYQSYRVQRGDSLWTIARKHGTTVTRLKTLNAMDDSEIFPGQKLMVPTD